MRRRALFALAAVVAAALPRPAAAQAHPDFSGHWVLAPSPPGAGAAREAGRSVDLGSGWGPAFTVVQRSDTLMAEREFFSPADLEPPMRFRYALSGAETTNTVEMGRGAQRQTATARWEGERLVISVVYSDPTEPGHVTSDVRFTLWYQAAPREAHPPLLVIETWRGGAMGGAPTTTRTVYVRN